MIISLKDIYFRVCASAKYDMSDQFSFLPCEDNGGTGIVALFHTRSAGAAEDYDCTCKFCHKLRNHIDQPFCCLLIKQKTTFY